MITFIPGGESAMGGMYNYEILRTLATARGGIVITMEVCWGFLLRSPVTRHTTHTPSPPSSPLRNSGIALTVWSFHVIAIVFEWLRYSVQC
jgi:hypothetical protein